MCGNQELHRLIYFDVLSGRPSWPGLRLYTVLCCVLRLMADLIYQFGRSIHRGAGEKLLYCSSISILTTMQLHDGCRLCAMRENSRGQKHPQTMRNAGEFTRTKNTRIL